MDRVRAKGPTGPQIPEISGRRPDRAVLEQIKAEKKRNETQKPIGRDQTLAVPFIAHDGLDGTEVFVRSEICSNNVYTPLM